MRIVGREEFLAMDAGTLYHKKDPRGLVFGSLSVKGENAGANDWYAIEFGWVDADDSFDASEQVLEMLGDPKASYPLDVSECRDGLFDDHQMFLVYESADVDALLGVVRGSTAWG